MFWRLDPSLQPVQLKVNCLFQGVSSDKPIVKVNNQVLAGEVINNLGSDLLFEIESQPGKFTFISELSFYTDSE